MWGWGGQEGMMKKNNLFGGGGELRRERGRKGEKTNPRGHLLQVGMKEEMKQPLVA